MQLLPKEGWRYAALLVLLFTIAAVAVREVLRYIEPMVPEQDFLVASAVIASLMLGFMLIAGAFGLWAIRFSAEAESARRIGGVVDRMDYIRDGVVALDRHGVVTGLNPTAAERFGDELRRGQPLTKVFATLTETDCAVLLDQGEPREIEREIRLAGKRASLRFRSQPAQGTTIVLLSDITNMMRDRVRRRQNAYLQLLGHIARGVANDFNDLLCGISGHAAIIKRTLGIPGQVVASAGDIEAGAERGLRLAGHLIELATAGARSRATGRLGTHVRAAINLLGDGLDSAWTTELDVAEALPPVGISGPQIEQVLHSLGLLATDVGATRGHLTVVARPPTSDGITGGSPSAAAVILVATLARSELDALGPVTFQPPEESGVLESVVAAMLNEADGSLEIARPAHDCIIYRVQLPPAPDRESWSQEEFPEELAAYMAGWRILIAGRNEALTALATGLRTGGVAVEAVSDITQALARIERGTDLAAMLLDRGLLGAEADGLLRAIAKLCPTAGILVLHANAENLAPDTAEGRTFLAAPFDAPVAQLQRMIIEARTLAANRR